MGFTKPMIDFEILADSQHKYVNNKGPDQSANQAVNCTVTDSLNTVENSDVQQ